MFVVVPTLGLLAGLAAVAALLLTANSPIRALAYLAGAAGAVMTLIAPVFGAYLLTAASIAQWPGQVIKFAGALVALSVLLWALGTRRTLVPRDALFGLLALLTGLACGSALVLLMGEDRDMFNTPSWLRVINPLNIPHERSIRVAVSYLSNLGLFWTLVTLTTSATVVRRLALSMLLSGIVIALIGLAQFKFHFTWVTSEAAILEGLPVAAPLGLLNGGGVTYNGVFRIDSLTGAADYLAMSMQILIPFGVFWTVRQATVWQRLVGILGVVAMATALLLTFSRSILLTSALVLIPGLVIKFGLRRSAPYLAACAVTAAVSLVVWEPLRTRVFSIVDEILKRDPSTAGGWRLEMIGPTLAIFRDHFLGGVGIGEQQALFTQYLPSYLLYDQSFDFQLPIHNGYLLLGVELGIGGLTLLVTLVVVTWSRLRSLQRFFRHSGALDMVAVAHAAEVAWVGTAVNMLFFPVVDATFRYFWLLLALVGALSRVRWELQRKTHAVPAQDA